MHKERLVLPKNQFLASFKGECLYAGSGMRLFHSPGNCTLANIFEGFFTGELSGTTPGDYDRSVE
jgi:hypothetical protein